MTENDNERLCMLYSYHKDVKAPESINLSGLFRPVALPQNKFFEGYALGGDWSALTADWIGHVTYSYPQKIPEFDFHDVVAKNKDRDIIGLLPDWSPFGLDMYTFAEVHHPGFMRIWIRLLHLLGYGDYRQYSMPTPFYCNYWIMKRDWFQKYNDVVRKAMKLLEEDTQLREWVNCDSNYKGTIRGLPTETLIEISGKPYYTFHPFVIERLVCFFAVAEKANLFIVPRQKNEMYARKKY